MKENFKDVIMSASDMDVEQSCYYPHNDGAHCSASISTILYLILYTIVIYSSVKDPKRDSNACLEVEGS